MLEGTARLIGMLLVILPAALWGSRVSQREPRKPRDAALTAALQRLPGWVFVASMIVGLGLIVVANL